MLRDEARQLAAQQVGVPCTVVRSAAVLQLPGGQSDLSFNQVRAWMEHFLWCALQVFSAS